MIYPEATGADLSEAQAEALDDTFLSSDPFALTMARISMMRAWRAQASERGPEPSAAQDETEMPIEAIEERDVRTGASDRQSRPRIVATQLALDAFVLRQQLAENTVRLAWAALDDSAQQPHCLWLKVSEGPTTVHDVNRRLWAALKLESTGQRLADLLLPAPEIYLRLDKDDVVSSLEVFESWFRYASMLLTRSDLYLHGVYNKTKHGLAVAARDDVRLMLMTAAPGPEGKIKLSDINGPKTTDVIRAPVIEALHRSPGRRRDSPGLEVSQVQIDLDEVLQECEMVAWLHGALFHGVAREHFERRREQGDGLTAPPHPGLYVDGPTPRTDDYGLPTGLRDRITLGGENLPERKTGIALPGRFVGLAQKAPMQKGQVVDG